MLRLRSLRSSTSLSLLQPSFKSISLSGAYSRIQMDAVIDPSEDKIRVISHNQYQASDQLSPSTVQLSPVDQFCLWFTEAQGKVHEPEAMSVSTATANGMPSSRFVLLKQVDKKGFVFFTNYTSRKSQELLENPHAGGTSQKQTKSESPKTARTYRYKFGRIGLLDYKRKRKEKSSKHTHQIKP